MINKLIAVVTDLPKCSGRALVNRVCVYMEIDSRGVFMGEEMAGVPSMPKPVCTSKSTH